MAEETSISGTNDDALVVEAVTTVIRALQGLSPEGRSRVISGVSAVFGVAQPSGRTLVNFPTAAPTSDSTRPGSQFSDDRTPSPKEFLFEKRPQTDMERVACLAYYLTHYRETPHFKTLDLSKLNTEAAQIKFSNAAKAVDNAARAGYLVQATKGAKQISALGERYVQALPDRVAAKEAMAHSRPRKKNRKSSRAGNGNEGGEN